MAPFRGCAHCGQVVGPRQRVAYSGPGNWVMHRRCFRAWADARQARRDAWMEHERRKWGCMAAPARPEGA